MIFTLILIAAYFLPWIIAASRYHNNIGSIFVVNLFLGWTFLGWVVALAWSCSSNVSTENHDKPVLEYVE